MSAHGGQPYLAPYVAAKAGLAGLTRNAAHAHRRDRIRINGLNIGWTDTEGEDETQRRFHGAGDDWREQAAASLPMGKLGQPDEIADFVVFLLSDRSGVVTGSVIDWDQNISGSFNFMAAGSKVLGLPYMRRFLRAWQEADLADPVPGGLAPAGLDAPVPAGPDAPVSVLVDPGLRRVLLDGMPEDAVAGVMGAARAGVPVPRIIDVIAAVAAARLRALRGHRFGYRRHQGCTAGWTSRTRLPT